MRGCRRRRRRVDAVDAHRPAVDEFGHGDGLQRASSLERWKSQKTSPTCGLDAPVTLAAHPSSYRTTQPTRRSGTMPSCDQTIFWETLESMWERKQAPLGVSGSSPSPTKRWRKPVRIVLDTNVLFSALNSGTGPPGRVLAAICGVAFASAVLSAVVGLAGGSVLLVVMLLVFEPAAAIPLHGVIQLLSNGTRTVVQGRHVAWSVVGWYSLFLLPLALAGARVALAMPAALGTTLIGVFVLVATLRPGWLRVRPAGARGEARRFAVLGGVAGFLGSLLGAVGPLVAPFFLHLGLSRRGVVGTAAACQAAGHLAKIAAFGWVGFSYREHLGLLVAMSMLVIAGTAVGSRLLDRLDEVSSRASTVPSSFSSRCAWCRARCGCTTWLRLRGRRACLFPRSTALAGAEARLPRAPPKVWRTGRHRWAVSDAMWPRSAGRSIELGARGGLGTVGGVPSIIAVAVAATNVGATRLAGRAHSVSPPPSSGSSACARKAVNGERQAHALREVLDGGGRALPSPRVCGQLCAQRRTPPRSNSAASAIAPRPAEPAPESGRRGSRTGRPPRSGCRCRPAPRRPRCPPSPCPRSPA